jgi:peptidoglycan/LPS O-acetylase OafA/YrhL
MRHMPQLDGLRAFAVMAVLVHHLFDPLLLPGYRGPGDWGIAAICGVRLFFVLSGFLITGLLLDAVDACRGGPRAAAMWRFYGRRALRIFPVYYLVLAIALLVGPADAREQVPWLATYTYNLWISSIGWYSDYFSHFWSLCVEEQFYLFWPWIVLFAPRKHLKGYAVAMILIAPLFRWFALATEMNGVAFYTLTPSSLDALGLGALLAISTNGRPASAELERHLRLTGVPIAVAGLLLAFVSSWGRAVLLETFIALGFLWLVAGASRGFAGVAGAFLNASPVRYLGKISYGIYVYHLLVPYVLNWSLKTAGFAPLRKDLYGFAVYTAVTIAVASCSWFALERPFNALKDRLPNLRMPRAIQPTSDVQAGAPVQQIVRS